MDSRQFRNAMGKFATGVTVISTRVGEDVHGMTANAFMSVSLEPPLVVVSIDERASMLGKIAESKTFAVNILAEDQQYLSQHFAGKPDSSNVIPWEQLEGYPVLGGVVAQIVCDVVATHVEGDHTLYIGQVKALQLEDRKPLIFFNGQYSKLAVEQHI